MWDQHNHINTFEYFLFPRHFVLALSFHYLNKTAIKSMRKSKKTCRIKALSVLSQHKVLNLVVQSLKLPFSKVLELEIWCLNSSLPVVLEFKNQLSKPICKDTVADQYIKDFPISKLFALVISKSDHLNTIAPCPTICLHALFLNICLNTTVSESKAWIRS